MKKFYSVLSLWLSMCLALSLVGCGTEVGVPQAEDMVKEEITYRLLETPELSYEVPEALPGIRVAVAGYDDSEGKEIYFSGIRLPEEFSLIDSENGVTVYKGRLTDVSYNKDTGIYSAVGDFSEYKNEGTYHVFAPILGYSYSFPIVEKGKEAFLENAYVSLDVMSQTKEGVVENEEAALLLLLTYELYGSYIKQQEEGTPKILQLATKYVEKCINQRELLTETDVKDDFQLAAVLAKYSYVYQEYDKQKADEMIKLAATLWKQANDALVADALYPVENRMLAAAELYRATGLWTYRQVVEQMVKESSNKGTLLDSREDLLAAVTYVATKQRVSVDICTTLMKEIMKRAEEIASSADRTSSALGGISDAVALDNILWNMVILCVVEYVITNYEYGNIIKNQYYFLLGRNARGYNYKDTDMAGNPKWASINVMMLYERITNNH